MITAEQRAMSAEAIRCLLTMIDPPELLGRRKYRYTAPRRPTDRDKRDLFKRDLEHAYLRWRMLECGREESEILSVRRYAIH